MWWWYLPREQKTQVLGPTHPVGFWTNISGSFPENDFNHQATGFQLASWKWLTGQLRREYLRPQGAAQPRNQVQSLVTANEELVVRLSACWAQVSPALASKGNLEPDLQSQNYASCHACVVLQDMWLFGLGIPSHYTFKCQWPEFKKCHNSTPHNGRV